jgi:hypothetical protein
MLQAFLSNWHVESAGQAQFNKKATSRVAFLLNMARPARFERATAWFVARYSIQLSYGREMGVAVLNGAPGTIRTCDRLVRSQVLYPAELRALIQ